MGYSSWSSDAYNTIKSNYAGKSTSQVFTASTVAPASNPKNITVRECRDSVAHPNSTPIAIFTDLTGSMATQAAHLVKTGLGTLVEEILKKQPVSDPAILFAGIGDERTGDQGLQVGQYESGAQEMVNDLTKLVMQGGGGNCRESYLLAWYFMNHYVSCDAIEKRGQKGFIFTIGDEAPYENGCTTSELQSCFGNGDLAGISGADLLASLEKTHHVFHLIIEEGHHGRDSFTINSWRNLLGERAIIVKDVNKVPEIIMGILGTIQGLSQDTITAGYDSHTTALVVNATNGLTKQTQNTDMIVF